MAAAADRGSAPDRGLPRPRRRRGLRGRLPYLAYRGAETLVARLPHRVAYGVAAVVGETVALGVPGRLQGLRDNLRHAVPEADARDLERLVRANVRNLARSWVDVMEMRTRAAQLVAGLRIVDVERLEEALGEGRGVVIVSLHLGRWEVGLAAWNHLFGGMSLLAERLQPDELFEHIVGSRGSMGVEVIPIDTAAIREADTATARRLGAAAVRQVMRTLRRGGMVAVAIDRDLIGNGRPLPFFGADAPIPVGVVEVAIRAGAAIVPIILLRSGDEVLGVVWPRLEYDPGADRDAEVERVTREVLHIFEQVIREHPDQWHVLDPIWPPAAAAAPGSPRVGARDEALTA